MLKAIALQKEANKKNVIVTYQIRKNRLIALQKAVKKYEKEIYEALFLDLRKDKWEVFVTELSIVYEEIHFAL